MTGVLVWGWFKYVRRADVGMGEMNERSDTSEWERDFWSASCLCHFEMPRYRSILPHLKRMFDLGSVTQWVAIIAKCDSCRCSLKHSFYSRPTHCPTWPRLRAIRSFLNLKYCGLRQFGYGVAVELCGLQQFAGLILESVGKFEAFSLSHTA